MIHIHDPVCYRILRHIQVYSGSIQTYCLKLFKAKEKCNKAVNSYLLSLKFFSDWFVTSKIIGYLDNAFFSNDGIVFDDTDFNINTLRDSNTVIN